MKIINDNIYIGRGETATYDVDVIDNKTGYPYTIPGLVNPFIEFSVKKSPFDKEAVFRQYIDMSSLKNIEGWDGVRTYTTGMSAAEATQNVLYRYQAEGVYTNKYYYSDGTNWIEYKFNITFQFPYDKVSKFEVKTYKYQIHILDGTTNMSGNTDESPFTAITYCVPLNDPHDFTVGGSLSE